MKWMQRLNTVFYRLIISYTLLVMIVILTIGTGSYIYFSSSINEQIERINQNSLHQMGESITQHVVEKSQKIYIRLVMDEQKNNDLLDLFENSYKNNYNQIGNTHKI